MPWPNPDESAHLEDRSCVGGEADGCASLGASGLLRLLDKERRRGLEHYGLGSVEPLTKTNDELVQQARCRQGRGRRSVACWTRLARPA